MRSSTEPPAGADEAMRAVGLPAHPDAELLLSHLQVSVADDAGRILYVNRRFCEASGHAPEELVGQSYACIASGRHSPAFFRELWDTLRAGFTWHGELCNRRRDGSEFWVELTAVPLPAADGLPQRFVGIGTDITRVVEAEQQARRSETRFRGLAETISAAVILHRGGPLLYTNRALERISGYSRDELLRMSIYDLAHPDVHDELRRRAENRISGQDGEPETYETRILTKDGQVRWLEISAAHIDYEGGGAALGTAIDVTERKRAEAAQRHMQQVLRQIIDGDPVPTFVIDANHVVTHWNAACALVTGVAAGEVVGTKRAWAAFYERERPVLADLIVDGSIDTQIDTYYHGHSHRRSAVIPGAFEAESFFPEFGEGGRWLFFTAAPLRDAAGRVVGAIETLVDITERKQAEASLQRAHAELEHLVERRTAQLAQANAALEEDVLKREASEAELRRRNDELQRVNQRLQQAQEQLLQSEKMASIGQLAAGVAHEINNPVGYVQANLGALGNYVDDLLQLAGLVEALSAALPADHPQRAQAEAACRNLDLPFLREDIPSLMRETAEGVARVRKIVADLRDFSHPDSGGFTVVDLHQGLRSTLNIVHNELKYKCEVCTDFGELPQIECNPGQLNQVFLNLLVNAGHAIAERGRIEILTRSHAERGEVSVAITDTGCGIAAEHLGRIFDPFFTTKSVGKGTGLGLSLSYGIVQRHNGRIEVDSAPGRGSTFRVVLPVSQPADAPPA